MAISRSLMNRQLQADGGIMQVSPREKFGLGSKLKKFARKIIPNEVADIAVKAAPFVAPFNPLLAAGMSGIGTFDQTGSIGDSLKAGGMNYALGQGARFIGGGAQNLQRGFNPFAGYDPSAGITRGLFTNPIDSGGGLGKFFSGDGVQPIKEIGTGDASLAEQIASEGRANLLPGEGAIDLKTGGADGFGIIKDSVTATAGDGSPLQMSVTESIQKILSPNSSFSEKGTEAFSLLKRGVKSAFTKTVDGKTVVDKPAVMGALAFATSFAEAKALGDEVGVDITEAEYDEARKAEKKEEYAGYLSNFFAGKKDGGRIGFAFGSEPEEAEVGIMSIDVEADDDESDMDDLMAGITFSSAEKSFLFRTLAGQGGASRSYTMPNLYRILSNPNRYPKDAAILKEIVLMRMKKDGGRIKFKSGANRVSELLILRDEKIGKGEDVSDIEAELFQLTGKTFRSVGGISNVPTGNLRKNQAGVIERDYRDEGGFVPVGIKERADDVPAMLSKNEFVMTADAVRGIGGGDVEKGSKKLYKTMKQAEKVGKA